MRAGDVLAWLEQRLPPPPAALHAVTRGAVRDGPEPLPLHLARLGRELVGRVAAAPQGGRELALDLLAADALITYAFEAQAEGDVVGLGALAARATRDGA